MDEMPGASGAHPFDQVPIEITVSVGKARPQVRDLLRLRRASGQTDSQGTHGRGSCKISRHPIPFNRRSDSAIFLRK